MARSFVRCSTEIDRRIVKAWSLLTCLLLAIVEIIGTLFDRGLGSDIASWIFKERVTSSRGGEGAVSHILSLKFTSTDLIKDSTVIQLGVCSAALIHFCDECR